MHGQKRLAGRAIEHEDVAQLRRLRERGHAPAGPGKVEQHRLRGDVVVPDVVMDGLEVPAGLTGRSVERDDGARVVVEAVPVAAVVVRRSVSGRHVDQAEFGVEGQNRPGVGRSASVPVGRLDLGVVGGDRVPGPDERAGARVVRPNDAARCVLPPVVEHHGADDDDVSRDEGRGGDSVLAGLHVSDTGAEIDGPTPAEAGTGFARRRVEREETRVERPEQDARSARVRGLRGVGPTRDPAAVEDVDPFGVEFRDRNRQRSVSGLGVDGDDDVVRSAESQRVADQNRGRLDGRQQRAARFGEARVVDPRRFEVRDVGRRDLRERGVAAPARVAAVDRPARHRAGEVDGFGCGAPAEPQRADECRSYACGRSVHGHQEDDTRGSRASA